jgi:molybdate transport system substrate-binding protein
MRQLRSLIVPALVLLLPPRPAAADDLLVFAAASLTDVLQELGTAYEHAAHDHVTFNFGASGDLARQIRAGAPADVFFSADVARMEELDKASLVERSERRNVLSNTLVIVTPANAKIALSDPADLKKVRHIALANPESVPAGVYAKSYLTSLGLWEALEGRVVPTLDVRAALAAVEGGNADAGVVYATDAAISKKVRVAVRVPREQDPPIVYTLAPLKRSTKPATRALVRFLASHEAAETYTRYGFIVLPAE